MYRKLPFKEDHPVIPENYSLSAERLKGLKNRLDKDKSLFEKYNDGINPFMHNVVKWPNIL